MCNEQLRDVSCASSPILRHLGHLPQMAGKLHQYSKSSSMLLEHQRGFYIDINAQTHIWI